MINEKMYALGSKRSVIREIFEYSKKRAAEIGKENVFDFSIGNPNVPAPREVNETSIDLLENMDSVTLHGYTSAQGDASVRADMASSLNSRFGTAFHADNFYMTCGAAASVSICIKALYEEGDEFIVIAPFFPEYTVFIEAAGAKAVVVPADTKDFQINFSALEGLITKQTKGIIVNSPNNPSGAVYSSATIKRLTALLEERSRENGRPIFLIADEPYREISYGAEIPFVTKYYANTLVCYSFSKALSLPGERIGYVLVPDEVSEAKAVYAAVCGAARALGYVCAPSLAQFVVAKCASLTADVSVYEKNRDLLYSSLTEYGYDCVRPDGAFYLFVKALEEDAGSFCERAKKYELLLVPSDSFGVAGYVRIAYCVATNTIERALPSFKKLAEEYKK
ncbi:MAG: pyridoxal phosphate-dependent aminotransferase [Ruminococcaceae bacterium]|nr:pyridoxal phosphate-dependent aminotransferase [Oscillospiraceae bacterium]